MIREFLKTNPIEDGNDLTALIREMMAEIVEGSLEGEMEESLTIQNMITETKILITV